MKISIIMPTYNDANSITETLDSVLEQSYNNWQLIIINDGSTDNLEPVVKAYLEKNDKDNKIEYYYQENQDQLNAIRNVTKCIKGEYVYILHSDDLLPDKNFLQKLVDRALKNKNTDVFIGDLVIIDENSNIKGKQKVNKYKKSDTTLATLLLWLGRNLYADFIFSKKEIFINKIYESYLTWNMPFWVDITNKAEMLNVENLDFEILKYRVHGDNYINNEIGKLNVINGELRTATRLMEFYNLPFYKTQFYIYRIFNKLNIETVFRPLYFKGKQKNKVNVVKFIIEKRFGKEYINNKFLNNLVEYYKNKSQRTISIDCISNDEIIYKGKDMRLFNKNLVNNNLSPLYNYVLSEMKNGFDEIIVKDELDKIKVIDIIKFLCIYPEVKVSVRK